MLWIINGLVYGFFSALYAMVNQKHRFNGYVLGIWRGFGIAVIFFPFLFFLPLQTDIRNWILLISQGLLIGIYDSHLFFASARYGAGAASRSMSITVLFTVVLWWSLTPQLFLNLLRNGNVFITLLLVLFGFSVSYWYMIKDRVTKEVMDYTAPAVFALAGMSVITKEIADMGQNVWHNIAYYLVVATFVSGLYNTIMYIRSERPDVKKFFKTVFAPEIIGVGFYLISFSAALITSKNMAMRLAPNPGYVVALVLTAPIFVYLLNKQTKTPDNLSVKAGFSMIFFLFLIMLLVTGNYGIKD